MSLLWIDIVFPCEGGPQYTMSPHHPTVSLVHAAIQSSTCGVKKMIQLQKQAAYERTDPLWKNLKHFNDNPNKLLLFRDFLLPDRFVNELLFCSWHIITLHGWKIMLHTPSPIKESQLCSKVHSQKNSLVYLTKPSGLTALYGSITSFSSTDYY